MCCKNFMKYFLGVEEVDFVQRMYKMILFFAKGKLL